MTDLEDILLNIFTELRQRHVPLGLDDYLIALKAVKEITDGENLNITEKLLASKNLCCLLWAKSFEDQILLDRTFDIYIGRHQATQERELRKEPAHGTDSPSSSKSDTSQTNKPSPQPKLQPEPPTLIPGTPPQSTDKMNPKTSPQSTRKTSPRTSPLLTSETAPKSHDHKKTTKYHLTPRPPMDKRDMASIWRKLRCLQHEGFSEELDIQATTDALSHTGFLFKPVFQYHRRNQAKLVLMIDQGGSMEPFTLLMDALLDSIQRSGSLRHIQRFYFHDTPEDYLYTSPILLGARALDDVLSEHCQNNSVLLIGDAGAARGYYDSSRVQATQNFIDKLSQYTYLYSWLNPMPKARWAYTTAGYIAQLLPMFQLDWDGLNDTVNVLRGQSLTGA